MAAERGTARRQLAPRPVVLLAVITGVCLLGDSALYALLPSRLEAFAVTPTGAGWVVERVGVALPLSAAIVLAAVTTLAYGAFAGFWPLFIAHGLWGVSWSFLRLGGY